MDSKGNVWVADRGNKRLQVFDQDGKFLKQLTEFGAPAGVAIGKDDTVYVAVGAPRITSRSARPREDSRQSGRARQRSRHRGGFHRSGVYL